MQNPLLDTLFLKELDSNRNRTNYVRITSLTLDQYPIEQIEGVATGGSITIDGTSSVRRICNLTMSTKNLNINSIYWGITTRVKIEIGLLNQINPIYDDIIWFPMGVYILTDFKTSSQVNNYVITLSGKDKMCLLNGDISGNFNAETSLGVEEVENEDGSYTTIKRSIPYIIRQMIHHYAQEPFENIVIKDIDQLGLEILRNRTGNTLYLVQTVDTGEYIDLVDPGKIAPTHQYRYFGFSIAVDFEDLKEDFIFAQRVEEDDVGLLNPTQVDPPTYIGYYNPEDDTDIKCVVIAIEDQEDIGYYARELTYPEEDLIAGINETVTSVLDKIINIFGAYEYFYNIQGQFVFQAKRTYVNTPWNNTIFDETDTYVEPAAVSQLVEYSFEGSNLTTAYQNAPKIGDIKNDYTVWGKKRLSSGIELPIHMRYAIDIKPQFYAGFKKAIKTNAASGEERTFSYYQEIYTTKQYYDTYLSKIIEDSSSDGTSVVINGKEIEKTPPPDWLKTATEMNGEDANLVWWTVLDWAEYYKALVGTYPQGQLRQFGTAGFTGDIITPNGASTHLLNKSIFDIDLASGNLYTGPVPAIGNYRAYSSWNPIQHGYKGCTHTYEFFMKFNQSCNVQSWIYKPHLPGDLAIYDELKYDGKYRFFQVDWREIIYQMAKDYYLYNHEDDFYVNIHRNNHIEDFGIDQFQNGKTGYEQYYHDIQGFWRQLYAPEDVYDWATNELELDETKYNKDGWNKDIIENPPDLIFWFDFFDAESLGIGSFSVPAIGDRPKVVNKDTIRVIIYKDVPDVVLMTQATYDSYQANQLPMGYDYIISNSLESYFDEHKFAISTRSVSAHDEIDNLLYTYGYCNENVTLTTVPIYYLEPNTIISAKDEQRTVNGYYIMNKMTIPLKYNGTMQITAVKVPERVY